MKRMDENRIAVMDTTLRDGEQTPDVSYFPAEKLQLARLLLTEVGVDRIEIASTRVSESERESTVPGRSRLARRRRGHRGLGGGVAEGVAVHARGGPDGRHGYPPRDGDRGVASEPRHPGPARGEC